MLAAFKNKKEAALYYASLGWHIFPVHYIKDGSCSCNKLECNSPGKHPLTLHGYKNASTDKEQIKQWWISWPQANIALATGEKSGVFVIDVDSKKNGLENYHLLQKELGVLPDTLMCLTGGGGFHIYLVHLAALGNVTALRPGIDLRAQGGYVLVPPSNHVSGNDYVWNPYSNGAVNIAVCPENWQRFLQDFVKTKSIVVDNTEQDQARTIEEGVRNTVLTSLAGTMRRRGMSFDAINAALKITNKDLCQPPLSSREVETIARSVANYAPDFFDAPLDVAITISNATQENTVTERSTIIEKPPVLPDTLYAGNEYLNGYVTWAKEGTDAPLEYLFASALMALAAAAGHNRYYLRVGASQCHANMWLLLLGPSGLFRKSTALELARTVLGRACPGRLQADRITPESFYETLCHNPAGIFMLSEFSSLLANLDRAYMSGFKQDLTELFDCPSTFTRIRKSRNKDEIKTFTVNRPAISILGASTVSWLSETVKESDAIGGFLPRFLYVCCTERARPLLPLQPAIDPAPAPIIAQLSRAANIQGEMVLKQGTPAGNIYEEFYHNVCADLDKVESNREQLASYATRLQTYALKFALLFSALELAAIKDPDFSGRKEFSAETMKQACRIADWFYKQAQWLLRYEIAFSKHDQNAKKVLQRIRIAGGSLTHSALLKNSHMDEFDFKRIIATLISTGDIVAQQQKSASGRGPAPITYTLGKE